MGITPPATGWGFDGNSRVSGLLDFQLERASYLETGVPESNLSIHTYKWGFGFQSMSVTSVVSGRINKQVYVMHLCKRSIPHGGGCSLRPAKEIHTRELRAGLGNRFPRQDPTIWYSKISKK